MPVPTSHKRASQAKSSFLSRKDVAIHFRGERMLVLEVSARAASSSVEGGHVGGLLDHRTIHITQYIHKVSPIFQQAAPSLCAPRLCTKTPC